MALPRNFNIQANARHRSVFAKREDSPLLRLSKHTFNYAAHRPTYPLKEEDALSALSLIPSLIHTCNRDGTASVALKLKRRIIKASALRGRFLFISVHERPQVAVHSAASLLFFAPRGGKERDREKESLYTSVGCEGTCGENIYAYIRELSRGVQQIQRETLSK